jgi:hypothetical protein
MTAADADDREWSQYTEVDRDDAHVDIFAARPERAPRHLITESGPLLEPGIILLYGAYGAGKTWTATLLAAEWMIQNEDCGACWLDFEGQAAIAPERFAACGYHGDAGGSLTYLTKLVPGIRQDFADLFVVDAVSGLLTAIKPGASTNDDGNATLVESTFVRPVMDKFSGRSVVLLAHEAKNGDGTTAVGSQRWGAMADYVIQVKQAKPWSKHRAGYSSLICRKDRFGQFAVGDEIARLVMVPGSQPRFEAPSKTQESGAPGERARLLTGLVTHSPGVSRADAVAKMLAAHPHLGAKRSWYSSVDTIITEQVVEERDSKLYLV